MNTVLPPNRKRSEEITIQYFELLDRHLAELIDGVSIEMLELQDIANILCVSQKHLIKIIQETSGNHPCHFYVQKILTCTKTLLTNSELTISEIAQRLTYDPSNFTKFFKKYEGMSPSQFRQLQKAKSSP
ncbi:AraC family transcriptional regulator [Sphingobacterium siyangense]|uniref:helix-turn-helix domain-containing protein n=1 Tax=Sphingobacterium siyangense TaxID=459529 RepID=UPI003016D394